MVLKGPDGITIEYVLKLAFKATNNMAEYKALLKGLDLAWEIKSNKLQVYSNL